MVNNREKKRMKPSEIVELMKLKGWSRTRLAAELDLTENAVYRWLDRSRGVSGPASILMRMWLEEARAKNTAEATCP